MDIKAYGRFLRIYAIFCFVIMVPGLTIPLTLEWHNSALMMEPMFSDAYAGWTVFFLITFTLNCISSIPCFFIGLWLRREQCHRAFKVGIPLTIIMALPSILYLGYFFRGLLFRDTSFLLANIPFYFMFLPLTILSLVFTAKGLVLVRKQEQRPS